jgi:hypothetical protein
MPHYGITKLDIMRRRKGKLSEDYLLDIFREKHGTKFRYKPFPEDFTVKTHISIRCPIHGEFRQTIEHHMNGQGCPICKRIGDCLGRTEWIRRFESVHGRGKYDYSKVPEDVRQNTKIEIICPEHNVSFYQTPKKHWVSKKGCPQCGIIKQWEIRKQNLITRLEFEKKARAIHGLAFEYSELPVEFSLNDNIIIFCNEHNHAFFCKAQDHLNGTGCPGLNSQ